MEKHNMIEKKEDTSKVLPFEKKAEETIDNPEEGETSEEETLVSEQETEENKPEVVEEKVVTQKELDKVYARMKSAEEDAKKAKEELAKKVESNKPVSEIDTILEVQSATKGLEPEEVAELQLRAKANGISLSEARKDDNFKLWQDGRKAKVEKEKALAPNTNQDEVDKKPKTLDEKLLAAQGNLKEQEKILEEAKFKDDDGSVGNLNPLILRDY